MWREETQRGSPRHTTFGAARRATSSSRPDDYSKWENLDVSSGEEDKACQALVPLDTTGCPLSFRRKHRRPREAGRDDLSGERVLFITGAGISAPSGVPTFRGDSNSVWANFVVEWGTRAKFQQDAAAWYSNFWLPAHTAYDPETLEPLDFEPNAAHVAVAELTESYPNVGLVTQNVDGLHLESGVAEVQMVEVHGRASLRKCITRGCTYEHRECIENAPPLRVSVAKDGGRMLPRPTCRTAGMQGALPAASAALRRVVRVAYSTSSQR